MQTNNTRLKIWGLVLGAVVLAWVLFNMTDAGELLKGIVGIVFPLILGGFIALILNIPSKAIEQRLYKFRKLANKKTFVRVVSLVISIIVIIAAAILILLLVIPQTVNVGKMLVSNIPYYQEQINGFLDRIEAAGIGLDKESLRDFIDLDKIKDALIERAPSILEASFRTAYGAVGAAADVLLAVVFAFYLLAGRDKLKERAAKFVRTFFPKKSDLIIKISRITVTQFENFFSAQCTEALILGTLCTIGLLILRVPYAATVGVLMGVTSLIPVVGGFIGMAVGAMLIVATSPIKALIFLIFVLILQQIEGNLIYPKVVGDKVGLPGMWVLAAIIIGGGLLGIPGMLIGVPICSVIYILVNEKMNRSESGE